MGTWDGWSYPWASCLYARGQMPNAALRMLRFYAEEFVSPNTFHTNSTYRLKAGLDNNTWRFMSVEGSFMYLDGVQEMLLQCHALREPRAGGPGARRRTGIVIFPGIPDDWHTRNVAFDSLRAEGGFLIDARMVAGRFACAGIRSTRGGTCTLRDNFPPGWRLVTAQGGSASVKGKPLRAQTRAGWITFPTSTGSEYLLLAPDVTLAKARSLLRQWPERASAYANLFGTKSEATRYVQ